jgi:hypothetical protein
MRSPSSASTKHREREGEQQQIADEVEEGPQIYDSERHPPEDSHGDMGQVLVVEELRNAKLELGDPKIQHVLATRPAIRGATNERDVLRVVVDVRDRVRHLGCESDRVHRGGHRDEKDQEDSLQPLERQLRRDVSPRGRGARLARWAGGRTRRDKLGVELLRLGELGLRLRCLTEQPEHETEVEVGRRVVRLHRDDATIEIRRFLVRPRDTAQDREVEQRRGHLRVLLDRER